MRKLVLAMLAIAAWCGIASARPKVAILGLELLVPGTKADPRDVRNAALLTESLRAIPTSAAGKLEPAPGSPRELLDEKLAGDCETELPRCMAPIGRALGADSLVYGNLVKASDAGKDGYKVSLKLLDVSATPPKIVATSETFVPLDTFAGSTGEGNAQARAWAQKVYGKLTGEPPPPSPSPPSPSSPSGSTPTSPPAGAGPAASTTEVALEPAPVASPLALGRGRLLIAGSTVNLDISDVAGLDDPLLVSFAPSVWLGVSDRFTIGLTHDLGALPWTPRPTFLTYLTTADDEARESVFGAGLCVTDGCPVGYRSSLYNSVGADALVWLQQGRLGLAAHPGLDVAVRHPFRLDLRIGVLGHLQVNDRISIVFEPRLQLGVLEYDAAFNHDLIDLPIWSWLAINDAISVYLHVGVVYLFDRTADNYIIPLQVGASYKLGDKLALGLDLGVRNVNETYALSGLGLGFDRRALGLRVVYAP